MAEMSYPKRIYLELTNECNLACPFCLKSQRSLCSLDLVTVEKVMRESRGFCDYFYFHVQGEPLLYPKLPEALALAEKYQINIQLVTNGTLLAEKQEMLLQAKALRKVAVSLPGLFLVSDLAEKLKILEQFIDAATKKDLYVELRVWAAKDRRIIDYLEKTFGKTVVGNENMKIREKLYLSFKRAYNWPNLNALIERHQHYCIAPRLMICILSDGTITPCCLDVNGQINLGNIKELTLKEAWASARNQSIIRGFQDNKVIELLCKHCDYGVSYEDD